jgi:hypothetical protein
MSSNGTVVKSPQPSTLSSTRILAPFISAQIGIPKLLIARVVDEQSVKNLYVQKDRFDSNTNAGLFTTEPLGRT